jgi:xanthine dehydrogenase accessory factor
MSKAPSNKAPAIEAPFAVATVVAYKSPQSAKPGAKAIIKADGSIDGWIGGGCVQPIVIREALKALQTGKARLISISPDDERGDWKGVESYRMTCEGGGSLEVFIEPVLPKPELMIVGNSPIAQILAGLGKLLDFQVTVVDPAASSDRFPEAEILLTDLAEVGPRINAGSYVVVATMGNGDQEGIEAVSGSRPKYLGLIASKEKAEGLFKYLREKGLPAEDLDQFKYPAGLQLGGETLSEIALSVMAEITNVRRAVTRSVGALPVVQPTESPSAALKPDAAEARDPICGMVVAKEGARYKSEFQGRTVYFCCLKCKETFDRSPELVAAYGE